MGRIGRYALLLAAAVVAFGVARRRHGGHASQPPTGDVLIDDVHAYDRMARRLLGSFHARVAVDVAAAAPHRGRVLDVGCGPGQLALVLADRHALDVTGIDLDPQMIARAQANADARPVPGGVQRLTYAVGDVASLPVPDASFDVVVSTMALHHWSDPDAALAEIDRVLRPGGRALIWDLRPGLVPFHPSPPDAREHLGGAGLRVATVAPWRWPWRIALTQRIELVRDDR